MNLRRRVERIERARKAVLERDCPECGGHGRVVVVRDAAMTASAGTNNADASTPAPSGCGVCGKVLKVIVLRDKPHDVFRRENGG